jgi:hypothetical protein
LNLNDFERLARAAGMPLLDVVVVAAAAAAGSMMMMVILILGDSDCDCCDC